MVQHDADEATLTAARAAPPEHEPSRPWAIAEVALAIAILYGAFTCMLGGVGLLLTPALLILATILLWWRGPGWRAIGLRRPQSWPRTLLIGGTLSLYQFVSLYVVEPLVARLTSGVLPDVSLFRDLVGNTRQLVFWLTISWTMAAFMEEMVYRGWITARLAEIARYSRRGWIVGVVLSSMLFGAVHLYQGLSGTITVGLNGLLFGAAYLLSGRNLWCAIIAHGLTDTIGFLMIYFGVYPGL